MDTLKLLIKPTEYDIERKFDLFVSNGGEETYFHPRQYKDANFYYSNEFRKQAYVDQDDFYFYFQIDSYKDKNLGSITFHQTRTGPLTKL